MSVEEIEKMAAKSLRDVDDDVDMDGDDDEDFDDDDLLAELEGMEGSHFSDYFLMLKS